MSCARCGFLKKRAALRWSALESDWFATVWMQPQSCELRARRSEARHARLIGPEENRVTIPLSVRSTRLSPPHPATKAATKNPAQNLMTPASVSIAHGRGLLPRINALLPEIRMTEN